jgi:O-antigen ligase
MSLAAQAIAAPARGRAVPVDWVARGHGLLLTLYLLYTFIGTQPLFIPTPEDRIAGNMLDRLAAPSMTMIALVLLWARRETAWTCIRRNKMLVSVILFCALSLFWSDYPDLTLRRMMLLLFLTLISLGLAASLDDLRQFHARLFHALVFVIFVNLAATALFPSLAITDIGVAGIYMQKNPAGMVAMITIMVSLTYSFGSETRKQRAAGFAGAAVTFFFLLITLSKTSIGLTIVAMGVGLLFWLAQRLGPRFALLVLAGLVVVLGAFVVLAMACDFDGMSMLGSLVSDVTFTGRDQLWGFAWRSSLQRPWFGHGYGAFWDVGAVNDPLAKLEPGSWLGDVDVGVINQAHDGFLELCLHIGLPMTAVAIASIFSCLFTALRKALAARAPDAGAAYGMIALLMLLYFLHNFTEATLMMRGAPFCNLVLLLSFVAARNPGFEHVRRLGR